MSKKPNSFAQRVTAAAAIGIGTLNANAAPAQNTVDAPDPALLQRSTPSLQVEPETNKAKLALEITVGGVGAMALGYGARKLSQKLTSNDDDTPSR